MSIEPEWKLGPGDPLCGCLKPMKFADGELVHLDGSKLCAPRMIPYVPGDGFRMGRWLCHHGGDGDSCPICRGAEAVLTTEIPQYAERAEERRPRGFVVALLTVALLCAGVVGIAWAIAEAIH